MITPFLKFVIRLGPNFMPQHDLIDRLFLQKKIGLSLPHLAEEIRGLIFHQNVLFKQFLSILYQFSP